MTIGGCSASEPQVHIRIQNNGPEDITAFWLGAGGPNGKTVAYGAIPKGHRTGYRDVAPVLANYRKYNFITTSGKRYLEVVYPERHIGSDRLAPGHYTFSLTQQDGQARLKLVPESAPGRRD